MLQNNILQFLEDGGLSKFPNKVAIRENDKSITFHQLHQMSRSFATLILGSSDSSDKSPIAVIAPRGIDAVVADLGILYSGSFFSNIDPKSPSDRVVKILRNLSPKITLVHSSIAESFSGDLSKAGIEFVEFDAEIYSRINTNEFVLDQIRQNHIDYSPACIINTSGSTGVPKGVVVSHLGIIDYIDWAISTFNFSDLDVFASITTFHFDHFTFDLFVCLASGAEMNLIPENLATFPVKLLEYVENIKATFFFWVPTVMVNIANQKLLSKFQLHNLKMIFFAGEVFPMPQLKYWVKNLPNTKFVNLYGPTEITTDCTYFVVTPESLKMSALPIGFPCNNSNLLVLKEDDTSAGIDEVGELCVLGRSLALGYYNNPEQSEKSFIQNPLNSKFREIIYRTGDLVRKDEYGCFHFLGRKDFQIKHSGYRVELGEIESIVATVDLIANNCVLYDQVAKQIVLIYESIRKTEIPEAVMRSLLAEKLPKYMIPTKFHFIETMPMNSSGKIDRKALANSIS